MIWTTTNGSIYRSDDRGSPDSVEMLYNYGGDPRGLDINPKHNGGDIYWADYDAARVLRGSYYGARNQTIHQSDSGIFDVKLYITGRVCKHVYFTIPSRGVIARTDCEGQDYYELVEFADISPHGLDIQIDLGKSSNTKAGAFPTQRGRLGSRQPRFPADAPTTIRVFSLMRPPPFANYPSPTVHNHSVP